MRCLSQSVERGSRLTTPMRRPSSFTRAQPSFPQAPVVSIATGTKSTPRQMFAYFVVLRASADWAAAPEATLHPYGSTPCISHVNSMWFCVKHMWNTRKNVCFTCFVRNTHENTCETHVNATNSTCEPHVEDHVVHMWNLWRSHVFHMCFHVYFGQNM